MGEEAVQRVVGPDARQLHGVRRGDCALPIPAALLNFHINEVESGTIYLMLTRRHLEDILRV